MRRLALLILTAAWALVAFAPARAHAADTNATVAEALFSEGRRLMDEEKYDDACEKFAESQRLDPGTGTLLNLANCYEMAGRKATAWATWKEAASSARSAGQSARERLARDKAAALEGNLAKLSITVPAEAQVEGLTVTRNGEELNEVIWGTAIPVDAGTITVSADAPGHAAWSTEVTIGDGESKTVEVPVLEHSDEPEDAGTDGTEAAGATSEDRAVSPRRTWGYVALGVGGAGLLAGSVFGGLAIAKKNESAGGDGTAGCSDANVCPDTTTADARRNAQAFGNVSTVAIGVGAALAVTGAVLVLTAPKAKTQVSATPLLGGGALVVSGEF